MGKTVYTPDGALSRKSYIGSMSQYRDMYKKSIDSPDEFWGDIAKQFYWETAVSPNKFFSYNFDITKGPIHIKWMEGATTNICYNLLDRNVKNGLGDKIAYYW
ncbi:Acetyl-coenzyme A synthetase [Blattella germanica]|nr:Acetyl-coenzyme A synthetase [Blattella germanica]